MRYQLDDLVIDPARRRVLRAGECLDVSGLNYDFLWFLVASSNDVVEFDALMEGVWAPAHVSQETVTQRVRLLRKALGDDGRQSRYIRSVRGRGYQLVPVPVAIDAPRAPEQSVMRLPRLAWAISGIGIVLGGLWVIGAIATIKTSEVEPLPNRVSQLLERAQYYQAIGQQDDNDRAIELYRRVLQIVPDHTEARLGLSKAYTVDMCRYNADPDWARKAEELAAQVIREQPENPVAYRTLAYSHDCRGHMDEAWRAYEKAIALSPAGDLKSESSLAYLYGETGRLADALAMNLAVGESDPEQTYTLIQLGRVYELLGLHAVAESAYARSFELYPDNIHSNVSYPRNLFHQRRFAEARAIVEKAKARPQHPDLLVLAAELALIDGDVETAQKELAAAVVLRPSSEYLQMLHALQQPDVYGQDWAREMLDSLKDPRLASDPSIGVKRALLHQYLGESLMAVAALDYAVQTGYRNAAYLRVSPLFESLRSMQGYDEVLAQISVAVDHELRAVRRLGLDTYSMAQL